MASSLISKSAFSRKLSPPRTGIPPEPQRASAASWDNSYEVVEFSASRGETYEIVIRRGSGTDSVWYGVAWTVSGFTLAYPFDPISIVQRLNP